MSSCAGLGVSPWLSMCFILVLFIATGISLGLRLIIFVNGSSAHPRPPPEARTPPLPPRRPPPPPPQRTAPAAPDMEASLATSVSPPAESAVIAEQVPFASQPLISVLLHTKFRAPPPAAGGPDPSAASSPAAAAAAATNRSSSAGYGGIARDVSVAASRVRRHCQTGTFCFSAPHFVFTAY